MSEYGRQRDKVQTTRAKLKERYPDLDLSTLTIAICSIAREHQHTAALLKQWEREEAALLGCSDTKR